MTMLPPISLPQAQPPHSGRRSMEGAPSPSPQFEGTMRDRSGGAAESSLRGGEFGVRRVLNKIVEWRYRKIIDELNQRVRGLAPGQPGYIHNLLGLGRFYAKTYPIETEINLESGRLQEIVASDEACLFLMNHDFQRQDPLLLATFAIALYQSYVLAGKADQCPVPKILLNEDILKSQGPKLREIYEKMGAVGIDASLYPSPKKFQKNVRAFTPLIKAFCEDSAHLFLFPEGRLSAYKNRDLKDKFQAGAGLMVRMALKKKKRVKVVPVGLAYQTKSKDKTPLGSIHIGEPVYFTPQPDGSLGMSVGNLTPDVAPPAYQKFLWSRTVPVEPPKEKRERTIRLPALPAWMTGEKVEPKTHPVMPPPSATQFPSAQPFQMMLGVPSKVITDGGQPVTDREALMPFIFDVLIENMRVCRTQAFNALPVESAGEQVNPI
jgi:hypothetical protein